MKFTASRLSDGNKLFPDEVIIDSKTVTIKSPKLFGGKSKIFPVNQVTVSIHSPLVGFSDITFFSQGTSATVHGFTIAEANKINKMISEGGDHWYEVQKAKNENYHQETINMVRELAERSEIAKNSILNDIEQKLNNVYNEIREIQEKKNHQIIKDIRYLQNKVTIELHELLVNNPKLSDKLKLIFERYIDVLQTDQKEGLENEELENEIEYLINKALKDTEYILDSNHSKFQKKNELVENYSNFQSRIIDEIAKSVNKKSTVARYMEFSLDVSSWLDSINPPELSSKIYKMVKSFGKKHEWEFIYDDPEDEADEIEDKSKLIYEASNLNENDLIKNTNKKELIRLIDQIENIDLKNKIISLYNKVQLDMWEVAFVQNENFNYPRATKRTLLGILWSGTEQGINLFFDFQKLKPAMTILTGPTESYGTLQQKKQHIYDLFEG